MVTKVYNIEKLCVNQLSKIAYNFNETNASLEVSPKNVIFVAS